MMADHTSAQKTTNDFINTLRKCLNEGDIDTALTTITENKSNPELRGCLSDVIPLLVAQLSEDVQREKSRLFNNSEKLLNAIADEFEPEEVLLELIEDVEKAQDDTTFLTLLWPLQKVLLRLPKTRLNSLGWGLNAVQMYVSGMTLPENLNLDEDEEILMDADPAVEKISFLYLSLLPFYNTLIADLKTNETELKERKPELKERKIVILKFLLQLLGKPLAFLDLKCTAKPKSRARRDAENIVEAIFQISPDIFWFLDLQSAETAYDIGQIDDLSLATLYYLVLAEEVAIEKVPKVYNNLYIFQHALHLAAELFKYENQFVVHNGLRLSQVLINGVEGLTLSYQLLDLDCHSKFCKALTNIIIYNPLEKYRQKGLEIFQHYLFQFETRGRYLLVYNLMKILNHTGIIGYVISQYKDMLMQELDKSTLSSYFSGLRLSKLLDTFCYLHKGEESDLLELADQIVAALNLLRYLAIRDKNNVTKVWDHFKILEKSFLEPLRKGLMLSRAHYELKVKEIKTESGEGDKGDSKVSVTVAGHQLAELPTNEKLQMLYNALTSFDVMESLLSRLVELIESGCPNKN